MTRQKFAPKERYEVLNPQSIDEMEALLLEVYPDNRINAIEFQQMLDNPFAVSQIKSDLGSDRQWYTPKEIAEYFWNKSNYNAVETNPYSSCF